MGDASPLVTVRGLELWFPIRRGLFKKTVGHVRAVDGVDMVMPKGRTSALVGESGCGKTTLGKAVLQLLHPTAGTVEFDGAELTTLARSELKPFRRRLQIIFQDPFSSLDPRMMVGEILMEGMAAHRLGRSRPERLAKAEGLMDRVGLDPQMVHRYPHEFSGGQRQRIAIARCLAVDPEFIVCDEATSALDVSVQAQIINLLKKLQAELSLTYLFITHDLSVVEYLADEVCVMYLGRIVERGRTEEIFAEPDASIHAGTPLCGSAGRPLNRHKEDPAFRRYAFTGPSPAGLSLSSPLPGGDGGMLGRVSARVQVLGDPFGVLLAV